MSKKIVKCQSCSGTNTSCPMCGGQGYHWVGACGLDCEEYGHGATDCGLYVTNEELIAFLACEAK